MSQPHSDIEIEGFSNFEDCGIWTVGHSSVIKFKKNLVAGRRFIYLFVSALPLFDKAHTIEINIGFSKNEQKKYTFTNSTVACIPFPILLELSGNNEECCIFLTIVNPKVPADYGLGDDTRSLGIFLSDLVITSTKRYPAITPSYFDLLEHSVPTEYRSQYNDFGLGIINNSGIVADSLADYLLNNFKSLGLNEFINTLDVILTVKDIPRSAINNILEAGRDIWHFEPSKIQRSDYTCRPCELINVGGFWHSGSSAVYDYLYNHPSAITFSDNDFEALSLIRSTHALFDDLNRDNLINYFIIVILNLSTPKNLINKIEKSNFSSFFACFSTCIGRISLDDYSEAIKRFCQFIVSIDDKANAFLNFLYESAGGDRNKLMKQFILLNQGPSARELKLFSLFSECATFVGVFRDPRDQYLSLRFNHLNVYSQSFEFPVHDFINMYRRDRERYYADINSSLSKFNILSVQYEDFVLDNRVRDNLCRNLGLNKDFKSIKFNADISSLRIKKYLNITDPRTKEQISLIEKELTEFLW